MQGAGENKCHGPEHVEKGQQEQPATRLRKKTSEKKEKKKKKGIMIFSLIENIKLITARAHIWLGKGEGTDFTTPTRANCFNGLHPPSEPPAGAPQNNGTMAEGLILQRRMRTLP